MDNNHSTDDPVPNLKSKKKSKHTRVWKLFKVFKHSKKNTEQKQECAQVTDVNESNVNESVKQEENSFQKHTTDSKIDNGRLYSVQDTGYTQSTIESNDKNNNSEETDNYINGILEEERIRNNANTLAVSPERRTAIRSQGSPDGYQQIVSSVRVQGDTSSRSRQHDGNIFTSVTLWVVLIGLAILSYSWKLTLVYLVVCLVCKLIHDITAAVVQAIVTAIGTCIAGLFILPFAILCGKIKNTQPVHSSYQLPGFDLGKLLGIVCFPLILLGKIDKFTSLKKNSSSSKRSTARTNIQNQTTHNRVKKESGVNHINLIPSTRCEVRNKPFTKSSDLTVGHNIKTNTLTSGCDIRRNTFNTGSVRNRRQTPTFAGRNPLMLRSKPGRGCCRLLK